MSGIAILFAGVAFLAFTFLNAYWFLTESFNIRAPSDLVNAFGEALAPLITTCIRVMYLGVMGWIGSILIVRGISIVNSAKSRRTATAPYGVQPEAAGEKTKEIERGQAEEKPSTS